MSIASLFTGQLWKLATGTAAVLAVVLGFFLITSYVTNRDLLQQRKELTQRINDPVTGYVAQLAQARTNVVTLKAAVERQTKAYQKLSVDSQAALRAAQERLAIAQAESRAAEIRLRDFLATKPQGATPLDRVSDIDRRAMLELMR